MANSVWPQFKQTANIGKSQTCGLSRPFSPGKWMTISAVKLPGESDPQDLQHMEVPSTHTGFQAEILAASLPLRNVSPRRTEAKAGNSSPPIADLRRYPRAPLLSADFTTSGSSFWDTRITFDLEASTDIRRAASIPLSFGKPISRRIKSGWQPRAFRTASNPSAACPTNRNVVPSSIEQTHSRKFAKSSTTNTVKLGMLGTRYPGIRVFASSLYHVI